MPTNQRTKSQNRKALYRAVQSHHVDTIEALLTSGASVNAVSKMDGALTLH
jgi:hypothetical protein